MPLISTFGNTPKVDTKITMNTNKDNNNNNDNNNNKKKQ